MDRGEHRIGILVLSVGGLLLLAFAGKSNTITILVGLMSGLALIGIGLYGSRDLVVVVLTFLAFLTGLQAITDSWVLFKIVSLPYGLMPANDASSMAKQFGGSAALWALVWIGMDVIIFGVATYYTLIKPVRRGSV
jgi:disulfide bond formation protein DsbB